MNRSNAAAAAESLRLLALVCNRDASALAALYDSHGRFVYAVALRIVADQGVAEDLVQEVFLKVWLKAHEFNRQAFPAVEPWLGRITRNLSIDFLRSATGRAFKSSHALRTCDDMVTVIPDVTHQISRDQEVCNLRRAFALLKPHHRQVILEAYENDLPHARIAAQLQRPLGTIKTWLRQSLSTLRREMLSSQAIPLVPPSSPSIRHENSLQAASERNPSIEKAGYHP